jgi:hypothetical protein
VHLRIGALVAAVVVTALTALVTLPFAIALSRAGSTVAGLIVTTPTLLVAIVAFSRCVEVDGDRGDDDEPPPGSHEAL